MIVPMMRFTLLSVVSEGKRALETLRELGCVHLDLSSAASAELAAAKGELADAERAVRILSKAAKAADGSPADGRFDSVRNGDLVATVLKADDDRRAMSEKVESLRQQVSAYEPYGDFDPVLARQLLDQGIDLSSVCELPDPLPPERLSTLRERLAAAEAEVKLSQASLAKLNDRVGTILDRYPGLKDRVEFEAALDVLSTQGAVSWISGWVPADSVPRLRAKAVTKAWGLLLREAQPDETPPTLIRPPKLFRPMAALFQGLGIAPAYSEADVSVPFMCYFALFFAMLVGDGAYGSIFLGATLYGWWKTRPRGGDGHRPRMVRSWLTLLTVFSTATIGWGLLSNTWFGAGIPWCADWPTVKWLADPSYANMMLLCFTIGVSHLMLARIWNGICRLNDTSCIAEFGWAGVLLTMYLVTNSIVGIFPQFPGWAYWLGGISVAMVFCFTVKPSELKSRGIELGMLPLNIMGALGDIISYVRLFAVGLASVQVAANFNDMAVGLLSKSDSMLVRPLLAVAMVAVLLIGHGLNLAMAGLSILVHAVRLNTLEFSNHKGISWAGYAFAPFKKN